ncbi:MAG TPA: OB-fold nucleic acid binding domain-containing protein, partial [Candidatus Competibacteraceae bacterium]|nr:OB-fold nucleic acid binding domain-containing protein [Candidatus Competibacteraceae bacterium]
MPVHAIAALQQGQVPLGSRITVQGWVRTRRDSKAGLSFVTLHDGSCFDPLQVIAPVDLPNYASEVVHLTAGCAVRVSGELVASTGKGQTMELRVDRLDVIGWVEDPETYPIAPKAHSFEYLRTVAHLRPRTNSIGAVTRVRHSLAQAIQCFFHEQGYCWVHTPIITASDCEGAGALFRVSTLDMVNPPRKAEGGVDFDQDFFGRETFLTVSG